jgi:LPXTG-site transpeptidase (sortase) family protein
MSMARRSKWLRRVEITLWVIGVSLLGTALTASLQSWHYQTTQERALFQSASLDSPPAMPSAPEPMEAPALAETIDAPAPDSTSAPEPLPGRPESFEAPDESEQVPEPEEREDIDPSVFGRIEIPRLGVSVVVREGADKATLARAVGLVPGSARPGEEGNTVLAGHRDTFFRPLRKIRVDDVIRIVTPEGTREYRVDHTRVVEPHETDVLDSTGSEELTLVTCYPFRFIGPAPERFIVKAVPVESVSSTPSGSGRL